MGSLARRRVLIIDDDVQLCRLVEIILTKEGATVFAASGGVVGLRKLYEIRPDLVILDVMMPQMDGWDVLDHIRRMTDVPVIMLTVLDGTENEVRALHCGADDFITKPFDPRALVARVEAVLRGKPAAHGTYQYDDGYLAFDKQRRQVLAKGKVIRLTRKEYGLLDYLVSQNGRVCTYETILNTVWGGASQSSAANVHVFVWQLRQKIEPDPREPTYIVNVPGVGYVFGGVGESVGQ